MALNSLSLKDKPLFNKYLSLERHELSVFSFQNIYIWKNLFDILWCVLGANLCVFFKDKFGCFMYLPLLGKKIKPGNLEKVFQIMDSFNKNEQISRIENIEEQDLDFYRKLGLNCREKYPEYLCSRSELAGLTGNKFKSKRASRNYFSKHYKFKVEKLSEKNIPAAWGLFEQWIEERKSKNNDPVYRGMLCDSQKVLKDIFNKSLYKKLEFNGMVVRVEGEVKAFTFGCKINADTFCVLYEITDLSFKGLAQFIFQSFCASLNNFKYINVMDDSGLENLKAVKLSYHPRRLIPAYIATKL